MYQMYPDRISQHDTPRRYRTILIDPPWSFARRAQDLHLTVVAHPLETLPVDTLADHDAHLWMWCTNATLRTAYGLLERWRFTPRAPFTWIKPCPGLDPHLRSRAEHLILGTRGNAPVTDHGGPAWMFTPVRDTRQHSAPEYAVIEQISPGPYLALFAMERRLGWDIWPPANPAG